LLSSFQASVRKPPKKTLAVKLNTLEKNIFHTKTSSTARATPTEKTSLITDGKNLNYLSLEIGTTKLSSPTFASNEPIAIDSDSEDVDETKEDFSVEVENEHNAGPSLEYQMQQVASILPHNNPEPYNHEQQNCPGAFCFISLLESYCHGSFAIGALEELLNYKFPPTVYFLLPFVPTINNFPLAFQEASHFFHDYTSFAVV